MFAVEGATISAFCAAIGQGWGMLQLGSIWLDAEQQAD